MKSEHSILTPGFHANHVMWSFYSVTLCFPRWTQSCLLNSTLNQLTPNWTHPSPSSQLSPLIMFPITVILQIQARNLEVIPDSLSFQVPHITLPSLKSLPKLPPEYIYCFASPSLPPKSKWDSIIYLFNYFLIGLPISILVPLQTNLPAAF